MIFILSHINNSLIMQKLYMTLLVVHEYHQEELFQLLILHMLDLFIALFAVI